MTLNRRFSKLHAGGFRRTVPLESAGLEAQPPRPLLATFRDG